MVGSNVGDGVQLAALRYADDDAFAMHELLIEAGVDSVLLAAPDADTARLHSKTVPSAAPTLDALRAAFTTQREAILHAQRLAKTSSGSSSFPATELSSNSAPRNFPRSHRSSGAARGA